MFNALSGNRRRQALEMHLKACVAAGGELAKAGGVEFIFCSHCGASALLPGTLLRPDQCLWKFLPRALEPPTSHRCNAAVLHERRFRNQNLLQLALSHSTIAGNEIKAAGGKVLGNKGTNHIFWIKAATPLPSPAPEPTRGEVRSVVTLV